MPLSEETRRRTWKPKSRSGCKTCKIRRVKCDEAKPFCKRCIKFGTVCDGYDSGFQARAPERKGPLAILPKVNSLALTVPSTSMFNDQQDFFYFSHFQKSTAPELAGPFDASIWSRVVLQACQSDQSVYRLTTALAALNKASMLEGSHFITEAESHRKYAIRNYGQALKGVQKMISEMPRPDTARLALIASLLIFCFESAFGQMDSAIKTIESSLPIMRKELSRARQTYRHLNTVSPTPALEDDLVAAFVRVENAVISVPRVSTAGIRPKVLDVVYIEDLRNIPYQFHNLRVARNYLENFQYWALSGLASEFESQINKFDSNMQGRETSKIVASQLEQWMAAFEPLYAVSCIASNPDRIAATSLRALCLSTKIAAQRLFLPTEPFVYESREIIDLSRVVVEDEGFRRVFVCECVIVPALFIVVTNCLDFTLRKEALQLLWSTVPRCEGTWDSLKLARMGESLLAAES